MGEILATSTRPNTKGFLVACRNCGEHSIVKGERRSGIFRCPMCLYTVSLIVGEDPIIVSMAGAMMSTDIMTDEGIWGYIELDDGSMPVVFRDHAICIFDAMVFGRVWWQYIISMPDGEQKMGRAFYSYPSEAAWGAVFEIAKGGQE